MFFFIYKKKLKKKPTGSYLKKKDLWKADINQLAEIKRLFWAEWWSMKLKNKYVLKEPFKKKTC